MSKSYGLALFLPELALLALGISLLSSSHRGLGIAIIAVLAATTVFVVAAILAARRKGHFTKTQLSWKISDHYPLWAEFSIRA